MKLGLGRALEGGVFTALDYPVRAAWFLQLVMMERQSGAHFLCNWIVALFFCLFFVQVVKPMEGVGLACCVFS